MQSFLTQIQDISSRVGPQAYVAGAGILLLFVTGTLSFWILIFSLVTHNWTPWKYIKKSLLISIGMIIFAIIITIIKGVISKI